MPARRLVALTMPVVTVSPMPKGLPIASTRSPTSTLPLDANVMAGRSRPETLIDRDVGLGVASHDAGRKLASVGQGDGDLLGPVDDVVVRDDVAVGADDDARAEPAFGGFRGEGRRLPKNWRKSGLFMPGFSPSSPLFIEACLGLIWTVIFTMLGATRLTTPAKLEDSSGPRLTSWLSRLRTRLWAEGWSASTAASSPAAASAKAAPIEARLRRMEREALFMGVAQGRTPSFPGPFGKMTVL
jgi:hypothetical protein